MVLNNAITTSRESEKEAMFSPCHTELQSIKVLWLDVEVNDGQGRTYSRLLFQANTNRNGMGTINKEQSREHPDSRHVQQNIFLIITLLLTHQICMRIEDLRIFVL